MLRQNGAVVGERVLSILLLDFEVIIRFLSSLADDLQRNNQTLSVVEKV